VDYYYNDNNNNNSGKRIEQKQQQQQTGRIGKHSAKLQQHELGHRAMGKFLSSWGLEFFWGLSLQIRRTYWSSKRGKALESLKNVSSMSSVKCLMFLAIFYKSIAIKLSEIPKYKFPK